MKLQTPKLIVITCCLTLASIFSVSATQAVSASTLEIETPQNKPDNKIHKVAKGETVYSIARLYNVSVADIYAFNPKAEAGIKKGDVIKIPIPIASTYQKVSTADDKVYRVKAKETLYSIARKFDLKVDDLINVNPELKEEALAEGQTIRIPSPKQNTQATPVQASPAPRFIEHTVESKETLYGIAKEYGTTPEALIDINPTLEQGLKQGMTILIPRAQNQNLAAQSAIDKQHPMSTLNDVDGIKVGVVLPFANLSKGKSARFVEYYEGFLLALEEMKTKGLSVNVYVFDLGSETATTKLNSLLDTNEMKDLDLIIGGVSSEQVTAISNFAKKQGIKYAIPFPSKSDETSKNTQVFQLNPGHQVLYVNAAKAIVNLASNSNVIYINDSDSNNDKKEFISVLNEQLRQKGMKANTIVASQNMAPNLYLALDRNRKNVLIASSGSTKLLQNLFPALTKIRTENPNTEISLVGYTEWQTYGQFFGDFYKNDAYILTPFYFSDTDSKTKQFMANYQKWYNNKSLINKYPRYAVLGYDTGIYFLTALLKYGKNFESSVNQMSVSALQSPIVFDKTKTDSGFVNKGFYLVHYKTDGSIDKIEYGK